MRRWALALLVLAACTGGGAALEPTPEDEGLDVVAAFFPLAEAARRVGGDDVTVTDLTPPGGEAHDLGLRPSDVERLRAADLVLYLRGFQPALDDAVDALPDPARAVDLLPDDAGGDPHVWLDPVALAGIVGRITDAFVRAAPEEAEEFEEYSQSFGSELFVLDERFARGLERCERREIFISHASFGFLAARYRLEQIPIAGLNPEAEPSPRRIEEVVDLARQRGATTIFYDVGPVGQRAAEAVARAVGAEARALDPLETSRGVGYVEAMRANLRTLREGLGCG